MPDPAEGFFQVLTPKGPGVRVGEEFEFRLTPDAELLLRVQCLEHAISCTPIAGQIYAAGLKRAGLQRLNL